MTEVTKRGRGRPAGTGKADQPHLARVADLLVADSSLKPTSAMKQVLRTGSDWGVTDETILRRWQVKWKEHGAMFLEAARDRARPLVTAPPPDRQFSSLAFAEKIMREVDNSPHVKIMREVENLPYMKMIRDLNNSPAMKAVREFDNSPAMKAAREFHNSPAMKAAREFLNSPAMKAAREFHNSPPMKAIREMQGAVRRFW
ncbi:hypothetical protein [Bradyrhizobium sp.]|uniref:hypothetical protein n=1 Tax=Bradyrhizobium sp. TaxID=376 RepID=UPI003C19913C